MAVAAVAIVSMVLLMLGGVSQVYTARDTQPDKGMSMMGSVEDYDPLVDLSVTVEITAVRYLEETLSSSFFGGVSGADSTHNFYVKVFINDEEYTSNVWPDTNYVYDTWTATCDIPDDQAEVSVTIQLWDMQNDTIPCDLSGDPADHDVELTYDVRTGKWTGDDDIEDASGYGRLCGTDDGTIYTADNDCELWFDIYQNDYDGDGIPYWMETYEYDTNPQVKDDGDGDGDGIPVAWEHRWGYDPFAYDEHEQLDPDGDSINNYEEYRTSAWLSDPYRKDVFVELDMMEDGPNGEKVYFPPHAEELLNTAFDRQNVMFHLDYGDMGGHELIPFDELSTRRELDGVYNDYFLHGDEDNWRQGVFHYGVITYNVDSAPGWCFRCDAFQLASLGMEDLTRYGFLERDIIYASGYMHELGHTFDFFPIPGHSQRSQYPWQIGYWVNRPYKSCMNYGWVYTLVDYSDGSRILPDIDDWERIEYDAFEPD